MMHFSPRNRHLYVELLKQEERPEPQILLPEDYTPVKELYAAVRLIDWAQDCNGSYIEEDVVVVRENMIEEIKVGGEIFHVVLENYVIGVWELGAHEEDVN